MFLGNTDIAKQLLVRPQLAVSARDAEAIASAKFGLDVRAEPLAGERDHNFLLCGTDGKKFILKVIHPDESSPRIDFQNKLLAHISRTDPGLPVPRIVAQRNGPEVATWATAAGGSSCLQCLTFLEGSPLHSAPPSTDCRRNIGKFQAQLTIALREFSHPAEGMGILWDTKRVSRFIDLADAIEDEDRRDLVTAAIRQFQANVAPLLPSLRHQVIHNDFNRDNILIDGDQIVGLIDFGDIVYSPIIQDLATTCAYLADRTDSFIEAICDIASGFHGVFPLEPLEISVLLDFVAARLALIVVLGSQKAILNPGNAAYLLRNQSDAIRLLSLLKDQSKSAASMLAKRLG